jgi:uncharacterized repeat protein (TIGR01451 family)
MFKPIKPLLWKPRFAKIPILAIVATLIFAGHFNLAQADDIITTDDLLTDAELIDIDADEITLETLKEEKFQMSVPDLPEAVLPSIFKLPTPSLPEDETSPQTLPEAQIDPSVKVNIVEINEFYYLLEYDEESETYLRALTQEAEPGDLVEIEIIATNRSDEIVKEVEMVNTIPAGPTSFQRDSVRLDTEQGFYRISSTGKTFFSPDAEIASEDIRFLKWQIFSLGVGDTLTLSYRILIAK